MFRNGHRAIQLRSNSVQYIIRDMDKKLLSQLRQESRLLHLLYHRNKNQHRASIWWKQFNILKRNVRQVVEYMEKIAYGQPIHDKYYIVLHNLLTKLVKKQLKKIFYGFNGIIALGQFVTLGLVLVGMLSRIYSLYTSALEGFLEDFIRVGCIRSGEICNRQSQKSSIESQLEKITNEEIGVVIDEEISTKASHSLQENAFQTNGDKEVAKNSTATYSKKSSKKERKRKKRSAIDDLFDI